ncbi:uncharacterized protein LOC122508592 [Leptopilina heterotoma]|uniref:uncharacterized protein LOC122508592 n=1 Tax=Leptopilina heterotoma TaxID=63436 RepID=UPI001CA9C7BC|nr:uncharacterized protein LOC122508592 [Leptopilina heterotoma]
MDEMEENLTGDETCEEGVESYGKFVSHDEQVDEGTIEYLDLDMEVIQDADDDCQTTQVAIIDTQKYTQKKRQRIKDSNKNLQSTSTSSSLEKKVTPNEFKLRPKYRPIRPKPSSQLNSVTRTNKLQSLTPIVNFNPTSGFIVAAPSTTVIKKEKGHETYVAASPVNNKLTTYSKMMTNGASGLIGTKDNLLSTTPNTTTTTAASSILSLSPQNELQNGNNKTKTRHMIPKNSVELFFESMAKTVLNLPTHVQAEIKMEICRVVTMAEIKYLSEEVKNDKKD